MLIHRFQWMILSVAPLITAIVATVLYRPPLCSAQDDTVSQKLVDPTGGLEVPATSEREAHRQIIIRPKLAVPSSASRLYPSRSERQPGTAAPIFLRQNFEATLAIENRRAFQRGEPDPLERELSDTKVLEVASLGLFRVAELERAAYREHGGWEYPLYETAYAEGGFRTLLPDVQESRLCSKFLTAMARASIAQGDVSSAERYLKIGLGLSRHFAETPFMVVKLVAAAQLANYQQALEELIQVPTAANYYWDLANLPRPLVEIQDAFQWEVGMWAQAHPELKNLDSIQTPEHWNQLFKGMLDDMWAIRDGRVPEPGSPQFASLQQEWAKQARKRLPELSGLTTAAIEKMGDAEVSVRYWWHRMQQLQGLLFAPGLLEPHAAIAMLKEREKTVAELFAGEELLRDSIMPVGNSAQVRAIHAREQRFCMLRTVEAIRHWAAEHPGQLPESLDQLSLPAPLDPLSGKAFEYKRSSEGKSAVLRAHAIKLDSDKERYGMFYVLKLDESRSSP